MHLFTFGSLIFPEVIQAVTGREWTSEIAHLDDHVALLYRGEVFPGLRQQPGSRAVGRLYHDLDADSLARLDRFEGMPYQRMETEVWTTRAMVKAYFYQLKPQYDALLTTQIWDPDDFYERHLQTFLSMCKTFLERDRAEH